MLLGAAPWRVVTNGGTLAANDATGLSGRIIEVQIDLSTLADGVTPVLSSVTLTPW